MKSADIVVIGAGLAGASAAWRLARAGVGQVVILEQETELGVHSSGRNAAMIRQVVPEPPIAILARDGAVFYQSMDEVWPDPPKYDRNGSLLLAAGGAVDALQRDLSMARNNGVNAEWLGGDACREHCRFLSDARIDGGVWCPADGVVDVDAVLRAFLEDAKRHGATLRTGARVQSFDMKDDRIHSARLSDGEEIQASTFVNAAGPWAEAVGRMAGSGAAPITPFRRHIFVTDAMANIDSSWPFIWDVAHDIYFRPEPPGLLLSPCDESADTPGVPATAPEAMELLAEKLADCLPALQDISIARQWAGLRTMAPDRRFVIGWDARVGGLFWIAGLGGHGVTACPSVSRLAASMILDGPGARHEDFDPARLEEQV